MSQHHCTCATSFDGSCPVHDEIERLRPKDAQWKQDYIEQEKLLLAAQADLEGAEALLREVSEGQKDFNLSWATLDAINAWLARRSET